MGLLDDIRADMTAAMKARDKATTQTLRSVIAAVQEAQVSGASATELDDDGVQKVIAAQAKRRIEAAEAFDAGGRTEKAADERAELAILERYLPQQLGDDELVALVEATLADEGITAKADMGRAMKAVNAKVAGRADGRTVADLVKSRLV
jgi:uncharacterized protein